MHRHRRCDVMCNGSIITAQSSNYNNYCFQNKMAAEIKKSLKKKLKKLKHMPHTIPQKTKEAIYVVNLFLKLDEITFLMPKRIYLAI